MYGVQTPKEFQIFDNELEASTWAQSEASESSGAISVFELHELFSLNKAKHSLSPAEREFFKLLRERETWWKIIESKRADVKRLALCEEFDRENIKQRNADAELILNCLRGIMGELETRDHAKALGRTDELLVHLEWDCKQTRDPKKK